MGTLMLISVFGIFVSVTSAGLSIIYLIVKSKDLCEYDQDGNLNFTVRVDKSDSRSRKAFLATIVSAIFLVVFFVLFIVACNLGI